jgi:Outer membrane lipoprotein carrier protein LolA-like
VRLGLSSAAMCLALMLGSPGTPAAVAPGTAEARPTPEAAQPGLDELMRLLATRKHGRVSFTEVQVLAVLKRPLFSSGELSYDAPDWLEKRTIKPKPETLVLAGKVLTIRRGQHTRTLELAQYPQVAPWVESIRATLAGDRGALERYFRVDFSGTLAHWSLLLVPTQRAPGDTIAEIHITGAGAALRTFEIRQTDGDHSILSVGPEIPP